LFNTFVNKNQKASQSVNDYKLLGLGKGKRYNTNFNKYEGVVNKSLNMCDIIYGRPLTFVREILVHKYRFHRWDRRKHRSDNRKLVRSSGRTCKPDRAGDNGIRRIRVCTCNLPSMDDN